MKAFINGFITKCAEFGVDYHKLLKYAQAAQQTTPVRGWKPGGLEYNAAQAAYNADPKGFRQFATQWRQNNTGFTSADAQNRAMMRAYHQTLTPEARKKLYSSDAYTALANANKAQREQQQQQFADASTKLHAGNTALSGQILPQNQRTAKNNYGGTIDMSGLNQRQKELQTADRASERAQQIRGFAEQSRESNPQQYETLMNQANELETRANGLRQPPRGVGGPKSFSYVDPRTGRTINGSDAHADNINDRAIAANQKWHNNYVASHPGSQQIRTYAHNRSNPDLSKGESNRFTTSFGNGANIKPAPVPKTQTGFRGPVSVGRRQGSYGYGYGYGYRT